MSEEFALSYVEQQLIRAYRAGGFSLERPCFAAGMTLSYVARAGGKRWSSDTAEGAILGLTNLLRPGMGGHEKPGVTA